MIAGAGRDALTEPPDFAVLRTAIGIVDEPVIASGGVRHMEDLRRLAELRADGKKLGGVVVGREVSHGRFTVEEAKKLVS